LAGWGRKAHSDYYQRIIALYRERIRDGHYPEFIIVSVDLRKRTRFHGGRRPERHGSIFWLEAIGKLAAGRRRLRIISANRAHMCSMGCSKVADPMISIVRSDRVQPPKREPETARLLGTRYTMQADFLSESFQARKELNCTCRIRAPRTTFMINTLVNSL